MSISINCSGCQTAFSLGEHLLGKKVRCKKCGHVFLVEEALSPSREQIQERPRSSKRTVVLDEEGPVSSPRRKRNQDDLPAIPSLRRNRWGLILALMISGLVLFLLGGGAVVLAVFYWNSRSGVLEQLDSDFRGPWPVPTPPAGLFGADTPEDTVVTLHIAGVEDESTFDAVYGKATTLADGGHVKFAATREGNRMTVLLAPVRDPQAFAGKIDFGTVRHVNGRTISVVSHKVEGPPPNADAVTKALYHLKSPSFQRRLEAAQRLKKMVPNERRKEVAQALQEALTKDTNHFSRQEIVEALAAWGTKDSVPALLNTLNNLEEHDPFTRRAIFRALARFQDERACEPLALYLEDFPNRHEAAEALKAMGPIVERAVLKRLQHPDHWVRWEACKILRVIGTKESLVALEKATADTEGFVPDEARGAIQAIKARQK